MGAVDENENITQKEDKTEKNHQVQPNSSYDNNISTVAKIWILVSALAVFIAVSLLIIIKERQRQN